MDTNFIFPGQGSQYVGMGKNLFSTCDFAKKIIKTSNEILEYDIKEICLSNDNRINRTKYTQPAIFIYSLIADYFVKEAGFTPIAFAGHSLGEYSALVSSKCISLENALEIIKVRSEAMDKKNNECPGKMCAVLNMDTNIFNDIKININGIIAIANYNSKKQIIISGESQAIDKFMIIAKENNIKTIPLKVSGGFHSPLMKNIKIKLDKIIKSTKFNDIIRPIYQNVDSNENFKGTVIKNNLIKQIISPVCWVETIDNMMNNHCFNFLEVGPNNVLTKLNKNINTKIKSINFKNIS